MGHVVQRVTITLRETREALGLTVDPSTGTLRKKRGYAVRPGGFR
jgi:hypothetical protein